MIIIIRQDCKNYDKIKNILHLRFVRDMDYIVINQEGNTKHMNRYFIDNKVPQLERRTKMVVADENQIVWVLGMRTGDNYKIDKNTCSEVLRKVLNRVLSIMFCVARVGGVM